MDEEESTQTQRDIRELKYGLEELRYILAKKTGGDPNGTKANKIVGLLGVDNMGLAALGWSQTCVFSVTDLDTVAWGSGTFTSADGTAYSIGAGNTGNMAAKTYIYLDTSVSKIAYQTTTTASTAVGSGKVLIAVAQNGTGEASFLVLNGQGGINIDASSIVANSITVNELALSLLYAGSIILDTSGLIRSGQTAYDTGVGFYLGNDSGVPKFSIGNTTRTDIAYDTTSNGGEDATVSSSTHSHTCTGTNLTLLILISANDTTLADRTVSTVTYNGLPCTLAKVSDNGGQRRVEIWYQTAPATGAHDIVVTMGGTCTTLAVQGLSLTGTAQFNPIDSSGSNSSAASVATASASITTLSANCYLVDVLHNQNTASAQTETSGQTNRYELQGTALDVNVGTEQLGIKGATAASYTWTTNATYALACVAIRPYSNGQYLTWNGAELSFSSSAGNVQTFTSSGSWTNPGFGTTAFIQCWGGGASGGRGTTNEAGGGGGGGTYNERFVPVSSLGLTETVTIGVGGAARTTEGVGNIGGNTTFGSLLTAYGGAGGSNGAGGGGGGGGGGVMSVGVAGSNSDGGGGGSPVGGAGGTGGAAAGASSFGGGGGGDTGLSGGLAYFGGGGGGGGTLGTGTGVGGNSEKGGAGGGGAGISTGGAAGGTSIAGGNGGAGSIDAVAATAGSQPGGGGGGSETGNSGAGGAGKCIVTIF